MISNNSSVPLWDASRFIVCTATCTIKGNTDKPLPALRRSLLRRNLSRRRQTLRPSENRPKRSPNDGRHAPNLRHRRNPHNPHRQIPLVSLDRLATYNTRVRTAYSARLKYKTAVWMILLIIAGVGHGFLLGPGLFSAQATCSQNDFAVATSVYSFLRSFGMCLGVAKGIRYFRMC